MAGGGGASETVQKADPWSGLQPYLSEAYQGASNLFQGGGQQFYPNQTYAGPSGETLTAESYLKNYALGNVLQPSLSQGISAVTGLTNATNNPVTQAGYSLLPTAAGSLQNIASGSWNPYMTMMGDAATTGVTRSFEDATTQAANAYASNMLPQIQRAEALIPSAIQQFQEQVLPSIRRDFMGTGSYGGTRQQLAEGLAASRLGDSLLGNLANIQQTADLGANQTMTEIARASGRLPETVANTLTNLYGQGFETATGRQLSAAQSGLDYALGAQGQGANTSLQAASLLPTLLSAGTMPAELLASVGQSVEGRDQQGINEQINRWNFNQNAPYDALTRYMSILSGVPMSGYGTTTSTAEQPGANPLLSALGGAGTGYGMAALAGASNPWLFALMGGAGGFLGSR